MAFINAVRECRRSSMHLPEKFQSIEGDMEVSVGTHLVCALQ